MGMLRNIAIISGFLLYVLPPLSAQNLHLSNLRERFLVAGDPAAVRLDSLPIFPNSVTVSRGDSVFHQSDKIFQIKGQQLQWLTSAPAGDTLLVRYRVFLPPPRNQGLDYKLLNNSYDSAIVGTVYNPYEKNVNNALIDFGALNYNGNFARGISVGNRQDLVLNSSFNLQLAGDLGDGFGIRAAISDENIPIQPQGNTRQLREFDRIFVQLNKDQSTLTAGDYELAPPPSYFMNYFKKLQGATFVNRQNFGQDRSLETSASVAVSRGNFARNVLEIQEGNQGPYQLRGPNGERFIIILAGTERVWLDGQRLERGLENDYIIDYNQGEISFTANLLIKQESRIVIEFEYADQNYLRSLFTLNTRYTTPQWTLYANGFTQQDSKNSTGNLNLSDEEKRLLAEAGDEPAVVQRFDTLTAEDVQRVGYLLRDTTTACAGTDTILVFTTNTAVTRFATTFTFVGPGNGNYLLDTEQAGNERVFRWVAPDPVTCQPQGNYAAVLPLTPPEQQQMLVVGGSFRPDENTTINLEMALTQLDQNRFSTIDADDDQGLGAQLGFRKAFPLGNKATQGKMEAYLHYEFIDQNFQPLNPYRNPEFLRDWSLTNNQGFGNVESTQENLASAGLQWKSPAYGEVDYTFSTYLRRGLYRGQQHQLEARLQHQGWTLTSRTRWLDAEAAGEDRSFLRPQIRLEKKIAALADLTIWAEYAGEYNRRSQEQSEALTRQSFAFNQYRAGIGLPRQKKFFTLVELGLREDFIPSNENFIGNTRAPSVSWRSEWKPKSGFQLQTNFTYRQLQGVDSLLEGQTPTNTFLGELGWRMAFLKGAIRSSTDYQVGSGQEARRSFTFVRVAPGEGDYIWLDSIYNNDGLVQPDEMEIAPFPDKADFIRVPSFSDDFIRTNFLQFNQSLNLSPKALWFNAEDGLRRFLSRFSTQSSLRINRKDEGDDALGSLFPFPLDLADTNLVSAAANLRNVLFFNRADPKYEIQLGQTDLRSKTLQTNGYESRHRREWFVRLRWNLTKTLNTNARFTLDRQNSESEFFEGRNYRISGPTLAPSLSWQPIQFFRANATYKWRTSRETNQEEGDQARFHNFSLEAIYNRSAQTTLRLRASLVNVDYQGQTNTPVGFAILNGLQRGQNYLWNCSLDQQLGKNFQLRVSYEGRKTGSADIVHVGRAQVTALF